MASAQTIPVASHPVLMSSLLAAGCVAACDRPPPNPTTAPVERRIVCSFLPVYVFTLNVVGDTPGFDVQLMLPPTAGCPHDYELTSADAKRISEADVLVFSGGLEAFAGDAARRLNPRAAQIEAWRGCDLIETECDDHDHGHTHAANPHVWLSPRQAIRQVRNIADGLSAAYPEHAATFRDHAAAYVRRLEALSAEVERARARLSGRVIVTTHDAFAYLARDLDLRVVATLSIVPGHEPSPARIASVVRLIRQSGSPIVFRESGTDARVAELVAREAGVPVAELDAINAATTPPSADYYERRMAFNLHVLTESLQR